jgi:hypothetical protein
MAREQTGSHFEAFYVSWISLQKKYYTKQERQDLRQKADFAVNNFVQVQKSLSIAHWP